jgi:hypothetical protein
MKQIKFFQGRSQTTFKRHSALDNGTYVTFKDAEKIQKPESAFSMFVTLAILSIVGLSIVHILSAWGF